MSSVQPDPSNHLFQLAADFVNNTSRSLFLTGKAGTGKTTFLKYIKEHTHKNAVVVAPTGVAAINAGGVTMHSFFQLPFGPFIPGTKKGLTGGDVSDKQSLFRNIRFNRDKIELLRGLELLIIDEVSMVRADMLDAMDTILRHYRRKFHLPFGGVQVLFIGDMYQLPPVVANDEWEILNEYYESPFFFDARALATVPFLYIELKKIYRQNEQQFIDLLNHVRNNTAGEDTLRLLNSRYNPRFVPQEDEKYITLTTHNSKADAINAAALDQLPGKLHQFRGTIEGEFSEKALPTEPLLQLKEGAQIMFIKNDPTAERRFYNGKIATVKHIIDGDIIVVPEGTEDELRLSKETWRNVRYTYHKDRDHIEEEELGSFEQYPVRLAWAITIHKSQGLTFTHAILDAGNAFAAGQVYVALSRCTSLEGMVLVSAVSASAIATDQRVVEFSRREAAENELKELLGNDEKKYRAERLFDIFDMTKLADETEEFMRFVPGKKLPDVQAALVLSQELYERARELVSVAQKFLPQLNGMLDQMVRTGDAGLLEERMRKAVSYFKKAIAEGLLVPVHRHLSDLKQAAKVKKYSERLSALELVIWQELQKVSAAAYEGLSFGDDVSYAHLHPETRKEKSAEKAAKKKVKGGSSKETLELWKEGKTVAEISELRNLAVTTIEGHLAMFVRSGGIDIFALVPEEKVERILRAAKDSGSLTAAALKAKLEDDVSFGDIRAVMNYRMWKEEQEFRPLG